MLCVSYVALTVEARLATINPALLEAAQDLGASPGKVFFDITLPLIAPALLAGWLLSLTISLDNVVMSAFLSGPQSTVLPLVVFSRMRLGLNPEIHALGTIFIFATTIVVMVSNYFMQRRVSINTPSPACRLREFRA
jgi:putrescine transport system permease protein